MRDTTLREDRKRHLHGVVEHAVRAEAHDSIRGQRLHVDVGRPVLNRLVEDDVGQTHNGAGRELGSIRRHEPGLCASAFGRDSTPRSRLRPCPSPSCARIDSVAMSGVYVDSMAPVISVGGATANRARRPDEKPTS